MEILHYLLSQTKRLSSNIYESTKSLIIIIFSLIMKEEQEKISNQSDEIDQSKESKFCLFLAIDAERTAEIINEIKEQEKLTQDSVNVLSRTANIEALWQGTESEFREKKIDKCFNSQSNEEKENEYDLYLLKITLNERELEFDRSKPATSRARAFRRLLKKEPLVQVSRRLPRESIKNNPHLYR